MRRPPNSGSRRQVPDLTIKETNLLPDAGCGAISAPTRRFGPPSGAGDGFGYQRLEPTACGYCVKYTRLTHVQPAILSVSIPVSATGRYPGAARSQYERCAELADEYKQLVSIPPAPAHMAPWGSRPSWRQNHTRLGCRPRHLLRCPRCGQTAGRSCRSTNRR